MARDEYRDVYAVTIRTRKWLDSQRSPDTMVTFYPVTGFSRRYIPGQKSLDRLDLYFATHRKQWVTSVTSVTGGQITVKHNRKETR